MEHIDNDIITTIHLLSKLSECAAMHEAHERTREIGRRALEECALFAPPAASACSPTGLQE